MNNQQKFGSTNLAMDLVIKEAEKKPEKMMEEMIPKELWEFKDVFEKRTADWFLKPSHMIMRSIWKRTSPEQTVKSIH